MPRPPVCLRSDDSTWKPAAERTRLLTKKHIMIIVYTQCSQQAKPGVLLVISFRSLSVRTSSGSGRGPSFRCTSTPSLRKSVPPCRLHNAETKRGVEGKGGPCGNMTGNLGSTFAQWPCMREPLKLGIHTLSTGEGRRLVDQPVNPSSFAL